MNSDFSPPVVIHQLTNGGNRLTPTSLNKLSYAINRMNNGVYAPRVEGADTGPVLLTNPVTVADVVATDDQDTTGIGQKIDGLAIDTDFVIFLQNQDDPTENGIWLANGDMEDWTNVSADPPSSLVFVTDGSVYFGSLWGLVDPDPDVLDYEIVNDLVRRFKLVSINANIITCNPIDTSGTVDTSISVDIARPYLAQSISAWNGLTFTYTDAQTRTATSGATTETQVMVPKYVAGDFIIAVAGFDVGIADVNWTDVNADARMWAKKAGT